MAKTKVQRPKRVEPVRSSAVASPTRMKVRATKMGYYDEERRRVGDVFYVEAHLFSSKWMVEVAQRTLETRTTGQDALNKQREEKLSELASPRGQQPTGDAQVLDDDE